MLDVRDNPALLKLDLYCTGMRMDESCFIEQDGGRKILRTRAGLGSGLEAILPGGLWTNIPVSEAFAHRSPYLLKREDGHYRLYRDDTFVTGITLSPRPHWYEERTSSGKPMTRIGSLQGTYLGVYPAKVCDYWLEGPKTNCKFCSVGLNLGVDDADEKSVQEVVEVARAARRQSGITYVDFNTGHYEGDTYLDILEPYIRAVKAQTNLLIGIQTPPHPDLHRYDRLFDLGVNRVSFCFEIWDERRFIEVCPGKHRQYGLKRYLDAVAYCAELGKRRGSLAHPWVTNGEIIAGLESPESSIAAIEWITSVGAVPTVCVFRPVKGTDLEDVDPPRTEDMVPVFARLWEACMEKGLPIGVAPNVHVSLVMLPEECAPLSSRRFTAQRLKLRLMSAIFGARFQRSVDRAMRASATEPTLAV
jgi:radical SAM family protein